MARSQHHSFSDFSVAFQTKFYSGFLSFWLFKMFDKQKHSSWKTVVADPNILCCRINTQIPLSACVCYVFMVYLWMRLFMDIRMIKTDFIWCHVRFRYQNKAFLRKKKTQGMDSRLYISFTKNEFRLEWYGERLFCKPFASRCSQNRCHSRFNFFKVEWGRRKAADLQKGSNL